MGTLDPFRFYENSNPSNFFRTVFLFARVLPLVNMWGRKGSNPPRKCDFRDGESVRKALKTFNLTTTTAILMYLYESVNQKSLGARN